MPNPYVTSVDRDAFWNRYRSTPEPALMMTRPPLLETPALYRDRWPSSGPYAGQSFPPFAYGGGESELTPIQQPLPEGMFPDPPSDMPINGLGFSISETAVSRFGVLPMLAAAFAAFHGYQRGGTKEAAMWAGGSLVVTTFVSPMLWPVVPAVALIHGNRFARTSLFGLSAMPQDQSDGNFKRTIRIERAGKGYEVLATPVGQDDWHRIAFGFDTEDEASQWADDQTGTNFKHR